MQPWPIQIAVYDGNRLSRGCERRSQAKTDRGPPHSRLRTSNDHAPGGPSQGTEVLRERGERATDLGIRGAEHPREPLIKTRDVRLPVHLAPSLSERESLEKTGITPSTGARSVSSASLEPLHRRARLSRKSAPIPPTSRPPHPAARAARNTLRSERCSGGSAAFSTPASTARVPPASRPSNSAIRSTRTSA